MRSTSLASVLLPLGVAFPALADVPQVATDIAPVHSLVAQVMQGVGTPDLILPPGASPHGYSLRPSEAAALAKADLVVWIGPDLTPWLEKPLDTIASGAVGLPLMELDTTRVLDSRDTVLFASKDGDDHDDHDHEDDHDDHADEGHDDDHDHEGEHKDEPAKEDHDDHDHDADHDHEKDHDAEGHDDHDHDKDHGGDHAEADHDDHGHDHGEHDPHVWLDPQNARAWLDQIADALAKIDPDNADAYHANAHASEEKLDTLMEELRATLAPVQATPFVVFHDAYQYFETRFGLKAAGAIAIGDASAPSPARIATLQEEVRSAGITCALSEPQFNAGLVDTVFEGTGVTTRVIDPIGTAIAPGPDHYAQTLRAMADSLAGCAK
ncbi:zinc ABC transporter substrate-binding protein [Aliiroseovarius crassostreae]|uniref:zinc ABC transporter substrate-binding protein n=1 Tax=Aliiroseovarius crassostreae TaxID=154981 RepID=UPI003C7B7D03